MRFLEGRIEFSGSIRGPSNSETTSKVYWRKPAIREWAADDIISQRLIMDVTAVIEHYESLIITANVGGKFDMTGLPDPLVCAFFF
jgi:hypothetical protein